MGTLSRLSLTQRGLNRSTAVLIAFFMSSLLLAVGVGGNAYASGENYSWEDNQTISASGGSYSGDSPLFSKGQYAVYPLSNPQVIELYGNSEPVTTSDGCFVLVGIQVNASDKSRGTLRRIADPTYMAASDHCPESYSLSKDFTTNIRLANSGQSGSNPSTVVTVTIRSLVQDGEDFPGSGDTYTLKNAGSDKVLMTRKATDKNAYSKDGMTGYERTFKFKTTPGQKNYEACSQALDKCVSAEFGPLTAPLDIYLFEIIKEPTDTDVVCSAGALGWVLCPVMKLMADTTEWVAGQLEDYLAFNPFAGADNPIRGLWTNILNVANVLLVIAFLVVIFSQSTSIGLSSYGIKRMLPRIIAAAILMNLSYYICQILVDLSNIAGVGITQLVSTTSGGSFSENVADVGAVRMALTATAIIAIILFFFLIPVVIAFLAMFFTLAARNAIIVLLVIVAPLAFAAWILPNTEKYFKKWWELFINMLILFPMTMLVFSASIIAANIIQTSATPSDAEGSSQLQSIIALIVLALPLFAMPLLFKTASGALSRINDMTKRGLNKYGGEQANKGMEAMRGRAGIVARERQAKIAERFGQGYSATGRLRRTRTALGKTVGWTASGQVRKEGWDARKSNAENTFKTLYEERGATDPTSRSALNAERKFELDQRNTSATQRHNLNMAEHITSNPEFTRAAAGVLGERGEARIRGLANKAIVEDRAKEVEIHSSMIGRNSSMLAAAGVGYDGNNLTALRELRDGRGNIIANAGATISHQQAGAAAGIPIQAGQSLDTTSLDELKYATTNNLASTNAGVRAVISKLGDTGALETKHIEALTNNLIAQNEDATSVGYVVDFANDKAASAGLRHLQYNNVSVDASGRPQLNIGGNMGGDTGVINRLMQEGVSKITKEMYTDNKFGTMVAQAVQQFEQANPDNFRAELTRMNPRQIENLINAKVRAGLVPPQSQQMALQSMLNERADAIKELGNP